MENKNLLEKKKFIISSFRTFFSKELKKIKTLFEKNKKEKNKKTKEYQALESLVGKDNGKDFTYMGLGAYFSSKYLESALPSHNFKFKKGETITLMKGLSFLILEGRKKEVRNLEFEIISFLLENNSKKVLLQEELEQKKEYYY